MSSAAKTLQLLSLFSVKRPEIGLSEQCRLLRRDKTTTYRHLQRCIPESLTLASREITRNRDGRLPDKIEASWAKTLEKQRIVEPAS